MRFNFIGQSANFGEGVTPRKANDQDLLVPSPFRKGKRKFSKKAIANKEVIDGSKK